jgi:hypothetical protein
VVLGVPRPHDPNPGFGPDDYMFEVAVRRMQGGVSVGIGESDRYWRGCFVLESRQGGLSKTDEVIGHVRNFPKAGFRVKRPRTGVPFGGRRFDDKQACNALSVIGRSRYTWPDHMEWSAREARP